MSETTTEAAPMSCIEQLAIMQGLFARLFGSVVSFNDPVHLEAPVVYVETPVGQVTFRPATADLRYFTDIPVVQHYPWEPHTSQETYERVVALTKLVPPGVLTYANPKLDAQ